MHINQKGSKKAKLLIEIKQGLKEVRDIREGRTLAGSMADLLGGK